MVRDSKAEEDSVPTSLPKPTFRRRRQAGTDYAGRSVAILGTLL